MCVHTSVFISLSKLSYIGMHWLAGCEDDWCLSTDPLNAEPGDKKFARFLRPKTRVSVEEENKSLRFLGLANTPLANASL